MTKYGKSKIKEQKKIKINFQNTSKYLIRRNDMLVIMNFKQTIT